MTATIDPAAVDALLAEFPDAETGRGLKTMGQVRQVSIDGSRVIVTVALTTWSAPVWADTRQELIDRLRQRFPNADVAVEIVEHRRPAEPIGSIGLTAKSVIAVGSGKG